MINPFRAHNERKAELAAEQRQMSYGRDQAVLTNSTTPEDDQVYINAQNDRSDLLRWQQDLTEDIKELKYMLEGKQIVDGKWVNTPQGQLLNDKGIQMIISEVKPLTNRNFMLSDFKEERILGILRRTIWTIIHNIADNDGYEAEFEQYDHIVSMVANVIYPAPFRAMDGGERSNQNKMTKRVESYHNAMAGHQERKKLFGLL